MITCQHHSIINDQPVCSIVAEITDRPLVECHTNDGACEYCLGCGIAPQSPNPATASMCLGVAIRTKSTAFLQQMTNRVGQHLNTSKPAPTACAKRGEIMRQAECKPCNAGEGGLLVDVFACPEHGQCTLNATGISPRLQSCAGCVDRRETLHTIGK